VDAAAVPPVPPKVKDARVTNRKKNV
jgi:hypothetical protein